MGNSYRGWDDELNAETNSYGVPIDGDSDSTDNSTDTSDSTTTGLAAGDYIGRDGNTYNSSHWQVDSSDNLVYDDNGNPIPDPDYAGAGAAMPTISANPPVISSPPDAGSPFITGGDNSGNGGGGFTDDGGDGGGGGYPQPSQSYPSQAAQSSPVQSSPTDATQTPLPTISSNPPVISGPAAQASPASPSLSTPTISNNPPVISGPPKNLLATLSNALATNPITASLPAQQASSPNMLQTNSNATMGAAAPKRVNLRARITAPTGVRLNTARFVRR